MTDKLSRLLKTLLAAFIMITSLSTSSIGVFAEENDDESYDATEEIIRLGTYDEVFGTSTNGISTFLSTHHRLVKDMPRSQSLKMNLATLMLLI